MQRITTLTALSILLAGGTAWAGCDYPDEPTTPNAQEMGLEEMQAVIAEFKEFQEALNGYRECLEGDFQSLDEEDQTEDRRKLVNSQHNASVDREQQLGDLLNEQIRIWRNLNEESDSKDDDPQAGADAADTAS